MKTAKKVTGIRLADHGVGSISNAKRDGVYARTRLLKSQARARKWGAMGYRSKSEWRAAQREAGNSLVREQWEGKYKGVPL